MAERAVFFMPNIKPISDLRNYNEVLRDVTAGEPVFLTKMAAVAMRWWIFRSTRKVRQWSNC